MVSKGLNIVVDARLELLTVLQYLVGHNYIIPNDSPYYKELEASFGKYKDLPELPFVEHIFRNSFRTAEAPYQVMLGLNYDFRPLGYAPESLFRKINPDPDTAAMFLDRIRTIAGKIRFYEFFDKTRPYYEQLNEAVHHRISGLNLVEEIEAFYGESYDSYTLFIKAQDCSSYGISLPDESEGRHSGFIFGFSAGDPDRMLEKVTLSVLLWHEYGHPFVNPVTAADRPLVNENEHLYEAIGKVNYAYGRWRYAINEQIIRTVTTYLAYKNYGKEAGDRMLRKEHAAGFYYTRGLIPLIEFYEANRDRYPTFRSYFKDFMQKFSVIDPDQLEIMPGKWFLSLDSAYVIVPDEELAALTDEDKKTASMYLRAKDPVFIGAGQVGQHDLSNSPVIALVNLGKKDNKWLEEQLPQLPLQFEGSKISAKGKHFEGDRMNALMTWENPYNKKKNALYFIVNDYIPFMDAIKRYGQAQNFLIWDADEIKAAGTFLPKDGKWEIDELHEL